MQVPYIDSCPEKSSGQLECVKPVFLKDLPRLCKEERTDKYLRRNTRYQRICEKLKSKEIMAQIQFLISIGPVFEAFLTSFKKQEFLIHILHTESCDLVKILMLRFMKQEAIGVRR